MIETVFEFVFEGISEIIIALWTKRMKKKNPNYDNTFMKKILIEIFKGIIIIVILILIIGLFLLILWLYPNLLNR